MAKTPKTAGHGHKTVIVRHHHAKPFRKRHYSLLAASMALAFFIIIFSWHYHDNVNRAIDNAKNFVSDIFTDNNHDSVIESAYGFSLKYNQNQLYASGVDGATGNLYLGNEMLVKRPYTTVRLSQGSVIGKTKLKSVEVQYLLSVPAGNSLPDLESKVVPTLSNSQDWVKLTSQNVTLGSKNFLKTSWKNQSQPSGGVNLATYFVTYTGVVNSKPMLIRVNNGLSANDDWSKPIIGSISFENPSVQAAASLTLATAGKAHASQTLLDKLLMSGLASAAAPQASLSEKNTALYSPAVVKIYNVYCMDISMDGQPYLKDACDGGTGSGFFVSSDGYIGTNGHVATSSPKDIVITDALENLAQGNEKYFDILAQKADIKDSDFANAKSDEEVLGIAVDKMYANIPDSTFSTTNSVVNLLVDLGQKEPNVDELLDLTDKRQPYTEQDAIKHATLKAADYRALDGINGFKASDVALIKINGSNYPVMKLGNIGSLSQGSDLSILGFPANASDNGLTDSSQSKVTLTSGKVSSIKNANGSSKKLIETDTTIGHGNSGGPVLNDDGETVGIATYTADGSGQGNGVFNYIRDIQDLKDLAAKSSVTFNTSSKSQDAWSKAIDLFYSGHYSKSLKAFAQAKALYPQNARVDDMVAEAQQRIKAGEDVKDFPVVPVAIGAAVAVAGIVVALIMIKRHKHAHEVYKNEVASGNMTPLAPGSPPQTVSYNPAALPTANNVFNPNTIYPNPAAGQAAPPPPPDNQAPKP